MDGQGWQLWTKVQLDSANRPYSYSRYWTGTSLQWRLMRGNILKKGWTLFAFEKTSRISLSSSPIRRIRIWSIRTRLFRIHRFFELRHVSLAFALGFTFTYYWLFPPDFCFPWPKINPVYFEIHSQSWKKKPSSWRQTMSEHSWKTTIWVFIAP